MGTNKTLIWTTTTKITKWKHIESKPELQYVILCAVCQLHTILPTMLHCFPAAYTRKGRWLCSFTSKKRWSKHSIKITKEWYSTFLPLFLIFFLCILFLITTQFLWMWHSISLNWTKIRAKYVDFKAKMVNFGAGQTSVSTNDMQTSQVRSWI